MQIGTNRQRRAELYLTVGPDVFDKDIKGLVSVIQDILPDELRAVAESSMGFSRYILRAYIRHNKTHDAVLQC